MKPIKFSYKKKLFISFCFVLALFTAVVIYYEQESEKTIKTVALKHHLNSYAQIIHSYIQINELKKEDIEDIEDIEVSKIVNYLPESIRISIINFDGELIYDNKLSELKNIENHIQRPEIVGANQYDSGSDIRLSSSTGVKFLYYAKKFDNYFIRVALPYLSHAKGILKPTPKFLFIVAALFVFILVLLYLVSERFGKSILNLKYFATAIRNGKTLPQNISFPNDELGQIGSELVEIFNQKEESKQRVEQEREKLLKHMRFSENGIAIYSPERESIYFNSYFILFVNLISKKSIADANEFFELPEFKETKHFLKNKKKDEKHFSQRIEGNGKVLQLHTVVYDDESFEIVLRDITKLFKNQQLKQEITNNIAHELRTPVTSIRGYLETLIHNEALAKEKQLQFITKAYNQSIRLSSLIDDVNLLSRIGESPENFKFAEVDLLAIINESKNTFSDRLIENNIKLYVDIKEEIKIEGNSTLLQSIFSNLIDNTIKYAGKGSEIHIKKYLEDSKYISISYYDNGKGVEEKHLNRLFERFYRVDEGRSSETGGTGLGLAIVRNAIFAHKGVIRVKNREGAGLEFLFTLKKTK